uniref:Uncharacterized protein n=1 Tax=Plectus sambesii TaxID=2011161 RepID=A0A914WLG6_9BILA
MGIITREKTAPHPLAETIIKTVDAPQGNSRSVTMPCQSLTRVHCFYTFGRWAIAGSAVDSSEVDDGRSVNAIFVYTAWVFVAADRSSSLTELIVVPRLANLPFHPLRASVIRTLLAIFS